MTRKKATLDRYRPLPQETVHHLNDDLRIFLTYHSNAIEGNTLSLRETQMVIEYGVTIDGHPLREYLEATNHAEAYSYMTSLVEKQTSITHETILTLHNLVMDKILKTKGQFRTVPVYIRGANMTPPPASQVESLMHEWIAGYSVDYLGWLVRQGRVEAVKRRGRWYSTLEAIQRYKAEVEAGIAPPGRPGKNQESD
ncbi:MAG: Fic family protein [Chloroflexi bacterium]|nr:MAG: Fic family protein [Chloroflexota bacterium]